MATLVVPNESKISKEALLLGDVTVTIQDCNGQSVEVHGLTGNDLVFKTLSGSTVNLAAYIEQYAGSTPNLTNSTITSSTGEVVSLQEVVDSVDAVQFTIADLQQKYNNL